MLVFDAYMDISSKAMFDGKADESETTVLMPGPEIFFEIAHAISSFDFVLHDIEMENSS